MILYVDAGWVLNVQVEVSPVKAMEYMGCGLPVVSFDLPETRRITEGAGVLVTPADEVGLAGAVVDLLDDPARREELGRTGRERVRDWLSWERQSPDYVRAVGPRDRSARPQRSSGAPVGR